MSYAILTNERDYTIFKFKNYVLKFKTSKCLEWYSHVKTWDNGYIEVMTKYNYSQELVEEYIDLIPIFRYLYIPKEELKNIKEVRVVNG